MATPDTIQLLLDARAQYIDPTQDVSLAVLQDLIDQLLPHGHEVHCLWTTHVNDLTNTWEQRQLPPDHLKE